jgi:hypothetical protein
MINYSIVAKDNNPLYDGFWDLVKYCWKEFIGVIPVLVHIDKNFKFIDNGDNIVIELPEIKGVDTGLQAQVARMWASKFFPEHCCILSDIDMLNFDKNYYQSVECNMNEIVIYSSDHNGSHHYPMCYIQAHGLTFTKVLDLNCEWSEFVERINQLNSKWGWFTDELYLTEKINIYPDQTIVKKLARGWKNNIADRRIDRININKETSPDQYRNMDQYIDFHCPRPLNEWKNFIEQVINYKKLSISEL